MEITSKPATQTVLLRHIDFMLAGPLPYSVTLRPQDTIEFTDREISIATGKELVVLERSSLIYRVERTEQREEEVK